MNPDKNLEQHRYDVRAKKLSTNYSDLDNKEGSLFIPEYIRAPYRFYEKAHKDLISSGANVLELAAGTGLHTFSLLNCNAKVYAFDISMYSIRYLKNRYKDNKRLFTQVADLESLPFSDETFDIVCGAGCLSYGDNIKVRNEIYRVMKKNGILIIVDSLNHHPIYRLNRLIHYYRDERSLSTLKRMPTVSLIKTYHNKFGKSDVTYFGSISWLTPLLSRIIRDTKVAKFSDFIDRLFRIRKSAFKFLMIAHKK